MKNNIKKLIAGLSAVTMVAGAMSAMSVFADDSENTAFVTRAVDETSVVITDYTDTAAEKIVIPAELDGKTVVGVDAFAFGLCNDLASVVVTENLKADYIDPNAFMTAAMIEKYAIPSDVTTIEGLLQYYAGLTGATYNDDMLVRLMNHLKSVEIPAGATISDIAIVIARDFDELGFSAENKKRFLMYTNLISYDLLTLEGPDGTDTQAFAATKNSLKYNVSSGYALGDVDMNGSINIFDAVMVARSTVGKYEFESDAQKALADMDGSGSVNIFDAVAIARKAMEK